MQYLNTIKTSNSEGDISRPAGPPRQTGSIPTSEAFRADLEAWRKSRPQYATLCKLVKKGADFEACVAAASEAGCTANELAGLIGLARKAKRHKALAKTWPAVQKERDRRDQEIAALEARQDERGLSANEIDEVNEAAQAAVNGRVRWHRDVFVPAQHAHECIEVAKAAGVA
jgi:hypothetical protein